MFPILTKRQKTSFKLKSGRPRYHYFHFGRAMFFFCILTNFIDSAPVRAVCPFQCCAYWHSWLRFKVKGRFWRYFWYDWREGYVSPRQYPPEYVEYDARALYCFTKFNGKYPLFYNPAPSVTALVTAYPANCSRNLIFLCIINSQWS